MRCPECGNENPPEAKFCRKCGTRLPSVCPKCGNPVAPDDSFCMECGTKLVEATPAPTEVTIPKLEDMHTQLQSLIPDELAQKYMTAEQQATGENRPITALFADISGFTPLSNTQSSETMFQLVQNCFRELVGIVARYEGSISGFRGDGLLALFGAPILHENDAERAILAAMDMRNIMQERQLQVSIGINTAMMTVGEIQTQLHREYTAYGTDVNLAKRLQEAAEPGQILVGTGTHRLTRRMFDFDTVESLNVRGFQKPVTAYIVQQMRECPEKLRGIEGLRARMIGREREFAELKEAADTWLGGQGQIVSIIGEAGIGKSRLVQELREYLASSIQHPASSILEGRCVSIGQPISYWPFLDILRSYLGLSEEDDEPTRARKVTESIIRLIPQGADEALPLLGNLLSLKFGDELDDRLKFATPEQIRHQTLMRLRDLFRTLAEQQPLLLILEDVHWADDLSLDLISLLMDELANTPLMLLCVYRPEKEHRVWQLGDQARRKRLDRYSEITLHPLSSHQSRLLVESLLEIENLPEATKDVILTKSEGNPFFIEEVIRSLIEQDLVYREGDHWKARDEIAGISVPDTIQSIVLARVDRLQAEARYVLQCASVIGRLFRYRLLEHISQQERDLDRHITEFESKELIYEERTVPELEYAFKHAFTQEATYEGILEQRRREFHRQVAVGIERLYRERLGEYYEELAHHYSRAITTGRDACATAEKAVEYLLKAGEKAKVSYANEAAIFHFQEALDAMEQGGIERSDWKLEALRGLGEVYLGIGKMAESVEAFEEAIALAKDMELPPRQLVRLCHWASEAVWWQSRYDDVIRYGEMGLEILGDDTECMEAALMNSRIAAGNVNKGDWKKWREYTYKNMAFIRKLPYSVELRPPYVHIVQVAYGQDKDFEAAWEWSKELEKRADGYNDLRGLADAWTNQGLILTSKGTYKSGLSLQRKSFDMFDRIGDAKHVGRGYGRIAEILLNSGDIEEAESHARMSLTMGEQIGNPKDIARAHELSGAIAMCQRHWEKAIFYYEKSLEGHQSIGNLSSTAQAHFRLGGAYLKKGDYSRAIQHFEEVADESVKDQRRLSNILGAMEEVYMALGTCRGAAPVPIQFVEFCHSFKERHADLVKGLSPRQWYLESAEPSTEFPRLSFADDFDTDTVGLSWHWMDEFGDCAYGVVDAGRLEICAANGRDIDGLNLSAPHLMRDISGDFATGVAISPASDDKPQMGGLLIWNDKDDFLRFEKGVDGQNEMRLHGYVNGKWQVAGRGLLPVEDDDEVHLRLERSGDQFTSYCSIDGEDWLTCGTMTLPMDDPVQVGIHAIGMIDRTIHCGAYKEGTATVFRSFRIWTRD